MTDYLLCGCNNGFAREFYFNVVIRYYLFLLAWLTLNKRERPNYQSIWHDSHKIQIFHLEQLVPLF